MASCEVGPVSNVSPGMLSAEEQVHVARAADERIAAGFDADGHPGGPFSEKNPPPGKLFGGYAKGASGVTWLEAADALGVVSWNVLAHVHTHWNAAEHGGAPKSLESDAQRISRHARVVRRLHALRPAVALLQEVDATLMPQDWQGGPLPCGEHLDGYTPFRSYTPPWGHRR